MKQNFAQISRALREDYKFSHGPHMHFAETKTQSVRQDEIICKIFTPVCAAHLLAVGEGFNRWIEF